MSARLPTSRRAYDATNVSDGNGTMVTPALLPKACERALKLAFSLTCSVDVYQLQYETVGARGESTTASGALMVPTGIGSRCQGPRPILLYAHGASTRSGPGRKTSVASASA